MDILTQILLSFCLATDAFAVSISNGICSIKITRKNVITTALTFGLFQGIMPIIVYLLGNGLTGIISKFQYFVALFLLSAIGLNMIVDAVKENKTLKAYAIQPMSFQLKTLFFKVLQPALML